MQAIKVINVTRTQFLFTSLYFDLFSSALPFFSSSIWWLLKAVGSYHPYYWALQGKKIVCLSPRSACESLIVCHSFRLGPMPIPN